MEKPVRWNKKERDFVDSLRVARLATADARGRPHNVPICPLLDGEKIYLGSEAGVKKVRNIEANPQVAIVFDDYSEAWAYLRGILIQGEARVVSPAEFRRLRRKMYAKYLMYESMAALDDDDSVIIEITPRRKFSWGLD
jgi:nitroimidazol reductase NimA-like FMN-containing flavoprotein (pyridoxamine 5'-phosphate oxidase superfamily)